MVSFVILKEQFVLKPVTLQFWLLQSECAPTDACAGAGDSLIETCLRVVLKLER